MLDLSHVLQHSRMLRLVRDGHHVRNLTKVVWSSGHASAPRQFVSSSLIYHTFQVDQVLSMKTI